METASQNQLSVTIGQHSEAGCKPFNQDFHGALIPDGAERLLKGITLAIADGISSSAISQEAAETTVKALMIDYYSTSDAWTVKTAASRVISATNSWLYGENRRACVPDMNLGRVCTLSTLILKGRYGHLFHIGDSRIWRVSDDRLESLTEDHTIVLSESESYLGRSMGSADQVKIDYRMEMLSKGDIFLLTTDGVHEYWDPAQVLETIRVSPSFDNAAKIIVQDTLDRGSKDNLTIQIVRIDGLPQESDASGLVDVTLSLPLSELPKPGGLIDGFRIERQIVNSARSHIYLAIAPDNTRVVLKFPSVDMRDNPDYLRRFVMEEWISRRIHSPHVLGPATAPPERSALYTVTEFVEGQPLRQWMTDNPKPSLEQVRDIIEQIVNGLRAFHRHEMLHQDLRPENIMINAEGTVKIIDFGSTHVAGVQEIAPIFIDDDILGTVQYTAPEYFLGYGGTPRSDLFSLGVIAYEMLTGQFPYGVKVSHIRTQKDLRRLNFKSTLASKEPLPDWIEFAIGKAVHLNAANRYQASSEFLADLKHPSPEFVRRKNVPLMEKNPVGVWQCLCLFFALTTAILLLLKS